MEVDGILYTKSDDIKRALLKAYKERFENRKIDPQLNKYKIIRDELCYKRLKHTSTITTPEWDIESLRFVLRSLKKGKARDPENMCNDLFKPDIAGIDFQNGLLFVLNSIKRKQILPKKMEKINITSIWKKKGSRNSIKNQRGICVGPVLRTIMDHHV